MNKTELLKRFYGEDAFKAGEKIFEYLKSLHLTYRECYEGCSVAKDLCNIAVSDEEQRKELSRKIDSTIIE